LEKIGDHLNWYGGRWWERGGEGAADRCLAINRQRGGERGGEKEFVTI